MALPELRRDRDIVPTASTLYLWLHFHPGICLRWWHCTMLSCTAVMCEVSVLYTQMIQHDHWDRFVLDSFVKVYKWCGAGCGEGKGFYYGAVLLVAEFIDVGSSLILVRFCTSYFLTTIYTAASSTESAGPARVSMHHCKR